MDCLAADAVVEKFLLINDCNVAKTKEKVVNHYVARGRFPEFFTKHPTSTEMVEANRFWLVLVPFMAL